MNHTVVMLGPCESDSDNAFVLRQIFWRKTDCHFLKEIWV